MKKTFLFILLIACAVFSFAGEIKTNIPLGVIENSDFIVQESVDLAKYDLILSPEKDDKFETIKEIDGKVIRTAAYVPEKTTKDLYDMYMERIREEGFEILFKGHADELGGDFQDNLYYRNPWDYDKNYEYSVPFKSSNEDTQYYIAAKKKEKGKDIYATINIIQGWSKNPAYRLDIIESGSSGPAVVSDTKPGEKELPVGMIKGSYVSHREIVQLAPYNLVLSPLNDKEEFEKVEKIEGSVARTYYKVDNQSTYAIYKSYLKQLESEGYEVLFKGGGYELGEDFQEEIYDTNPFDSDPNYGCSIPFKNGSPSSQYYAVFKKAYPNKEIYVVLNTVIGWGKSPDYRIDIIETDAELPEVITSDAITIAINEKGKMEIYGIYFDTGSYQILPSSKETLDIIAKYIKSTNDTKFYIVGHTDNRGGFDMNMKLSENRAKSVRDKLVNDYGIDASILKGYGVGPLCPVFSNDSESGRKFNRRVEIVKQ
ncbi:MAG: hypothetical protein C0601_10605 [Candidatus Muiribacterium halophilum]|uniref:OmpA-like domain-containing protein n=1 Tax=Muiribacterium halophilum TaxID=2053465 RepID=A0A2N5ZC52_MUIH1|nr:MAG: hypothetical protein C0601_10605 [Candidatus Muirbacterium halophilum]